MVNLEELKFNIALLGGSSDYLDSLAGLLSDPDGRGHNVLINAPGYMEAMNEVGNLVNMGIHAVFVAEVKNNPLGQWNLLNDISRLEGWRPYTVGIVNTDEKRTQADSTVFTRNLPRSLPNILSNVAATWAR